MKMRRFDPVLLSHMAGLVMLDALILNMSILGCLVVRFELELSALSASGFVQHYFSMAALYTVGALLIFAALRLYRSLWAYAGVDEFRNIMVAVTLAALWFWICCKLTHTPAPRSLKYMNYLALLTAMLGSRFAYRLARRLRSRPDRERSRTMLIGAGQAGSLILRDLNQSHHSRNKVVCIIDDDKAKQGTFLMGVPVVGGRESIAQTAEKYRVTDIILAIPTAAPSERRRIVELCQQTKCRIQTLPGIYQLASGQVNVQAIRDVQVEDLLGREKVQVDDSEIRTALAGKTILVTGGGGSIGSELCRQVSNYDIARLIIFDIYENNAYDIQQELRRSHPELDLVVLIGSVRDEKRLNDFFRRYRPQVVCHAAAHKHVPLMELSPAESIKNNVFGTYHVASAAHTCGAESFTLISTDKAVNPTNIMGASKRICEMIVQTMGKRSKTRFAAVRFGNVLGSNGSVIPLFKRQIAAGGPVTVTHKDIIRYFMTIPEAVSLVLQACVYAKDGEVFVLDMGDPVRIDDLARNMIRLSGLEPDVDIEIRYTGLRPGEKLYEELLMQDEGLDKTPNQLIFVGHFNDFNEEDLNRALVELRSACTDSPDEIRALVGNLVKTYHPTN